MPLNKQKIILIAGIALALIGTLMVKVYLDQQRQVALQKAKEVIETEQANQAAVLVAKQDIPRGALVSPESFEPAIVPNRFVQPQAVSSADRIAGMIAVAPISKGEQITLNKLTFERRSGALSEITPVGKRAIAFSVDNVASLLGMLKAGDYADIIALVPIPVQTADGKQSSQVAVIPLFQNVLILAVGRNTSALSKEGGRAAKEESQSQEANPPVTVALSPQEANLLAFVQEQGKIRLMLRSPGDSQIENTTPASWDTLLQYIMPKKEGPLEPEKQEEPAIGAGGYVEIYRGLNKEKVPLSQ